MTEHNDLDLRNNIQTRIKKFVDDNDIAFSTFAKALKLSDTTVKRWYNGVCLPDINLLPSLSKYMNISISQLLGIDINLDLPDSQLELLNMYATNETFKNLVDKFRDDNEFRATISSLLKLMK